jgi:AraC family transcriptional regulator
MKSQAEARYLDRIDRVVESLNAHLQATPTLEDLSKVAGVSPFHFHRLYRAITGETPAGTLRRLRLARAAGMLKDTRKSVTEIAFDNGFESSQAFAKALRRETGCSASELRRDPARLGAIAESLSRPPGTPAMKPLEVRLVSVEPFKVIAARHVGPPPELFGAYGALFEWAQRKGLAERLRGIYGVALDDPLSVPEGEYRFDCCFDFGADADAGLQDGIHSLMLGGGLFTVVRHVGPYEGLEEKSDYLYGTWLPGSGHALREVPGFNHYLQDPDSLPPEQWETDIYLPVQRPATI